MESRCRVGDLAVVIKADHSCNLGCIVRILAPQDMSGDLVFHNAGVVWHTKCARPMTWIKGKRRIRRKLGPVPDSYLQPIRGISSLDQQNNLSRTSADNPADASDTDMEDPRWMARAQYRVDRYLERCWSEKERRILIGKSGDQSRISMPRPHSSDALFRIVQEILDQVPGGGSCSKTIIAESGEKVTYTFSPAVGWASYYWASAYFKHFGVSLPDWVKRQHPYHVSQLSEMARKAGIRLPERQPAIPLLPYMTALHKSGTVTLTIDYRYDAHSLCLSKRTYDKILAGKPVSLQGQGFNRAGEREQDTWHFNLHCEGELYVITKNAGDIFKGSLGDAYAHICTPRSI